VLTRPGVLLRMEGVAMFAAALFLYHRAGVSWILFLVLFLWPDLGMLGYLADVKVGSRLYNLVHIEVMPLMLAGAALGMERPGMLAFALIWLAHIGMDRALGFGLKYPTFFKDTHLQRVASDRQIDGGAVRTYNGA
jgi:Domain of unknown function (DUF4260)